MLQLSSVYLHSLIILTKFKQSNFMPSMLGCSPQAALTRKFASWIADQEQLMPSILYCLILKRWYGILSIVMSYFALSKTARSSASIGEKWINPFIPFKLMTRQRRRCPSAIPYPVCSQHLQLTRFVRQEIKY